MNTAMALEVLLQLLVLAQEIGVLISQAHAEDRDISDDELDAAVNRDDIARAKLQALIDEMRRGAL